MPKKLLYQIKDGRKDLKIFYCLGCRKYHVLQVNLKLKPNFRYNGNENSPTFTPSIMIKDEEGKTVCHSKIENGFIQYFSECNHDLVEMKLPMSEV